MDKQRQKAPQGQDRNPGASRTGRQKREIPLIMRNKSQEPASRLVSTRPNQNASRNMIRQAAALANFLRLISDPMARAKGERGNFSVIHQGHNLLPL